MPSSFVARIRLIPIAGGPFPVGLLAGPARLFVGAGLLASLRPHLPNQELILTYKMSTRMAKGSDCELCLRFRSYLSKSIGITAQNPRSRLYLSKLGLAGWCRPVEIAGP